MPYHKQNTVESSTFIEEFIALKTAIDLLDGFLARKLNVQSKLGLELVVKKLWAALISKSKPSA